MNQSLRKGDIAFWIFATFLFGIFSASAGWNIKLILLFSIIAMVSASVAIKRAMPRKFILAILMSAIFGVIYYFGYTNWISSHVRLPSGKQAAFFGLVIDEPKPAGNFMMFPLQLSKPYSGSIDVFTSINAKFHYGDLIWLKGSVDLSKDPAELPVIFLPQSNIVTSNNGFWLKVWSIKIKSIIVQKFVELFSSENAGLLSGIVLGTTSVLNATIKAQMDTSGTSYIVGMYGYKIAIIGGMVVALLKDHVPKKILLLILLSTTWLFIFISGGTISAVRAGIMGSVALAAIAVGRKTNIKNTLIFTVLIMALFDPSILIDAAFQLSFLSFLGIYYLGPPIKNFFHWTNDGLLQWKEHAMLSFSTNFAILPVVMATFGGFSLTSLISNILIMIPWVLVIFFGIASVVIGSFSPALAFFVIQITNILLAYEFFIIRTFANYVIPMPNIFNSNILIIFYYGLLLIFIYYYGEAA